MKGVPPSSMPFEKSISFPLISSSKVKGQRYYLTGPEGMQKTTANNRTYTDGKIHIYTDM